MNLKKYNTLDIPCGIKLIRRQIVKHIEAAYTISESESDEIDNLIKKTLPSVEKCWGSISNRHYRMNANPSLNIWNTNQYCQLLLIMAAKANEEKSFSVADKISGINRIINSCEINHHIKLPTCFYVNHSIGIVMNNAIIGERLFLSQNCFIGNTALNPDFPILGNDNYLMANAKVSGLVRTGNRVIFGAGSIVENIDIPSDSIVFGQSPKNVIKNLDEESFRKASPFNQG